MSDATYLMWVVLPLLILMLVGEILILAVKCIEGKAWTAVFGVLWCLAMVVVIARVAAIAGRI